MLPLILWIPVFMRWLGPDWVVLLGRTLNSTSAPRSIKLMNPRGAPDAPTVPPKGNSNTLIYLCLANQLGSHDPCLVLTIWLLHWFGNLYHIKHRSKPAQLRCHLISDTQGTSGFTMSRSWREPTICTRNWMNACSIWKHEKKNF